MHVVHLYICRDDGAEKRNIIRNREPIRIICCLFGVHRENSAIRFIVFLAEYVRSLL